MVSKEDIDTETFSPGMIGVGALLCVIFGLLQIYAPLPEFWLLERQNGDPIAFLIMSMVCGLTTVGMWKHRRNRIKIVE